MCKFFEGEHLGSKRVVRKFVSCCMQRRILSTFHCSTKTLHALKVAYATVTSRRITQRTRVVFCSCGKVIQLCCGTWRKWTRLRGGLPCVPGVVWSRVRRRCRLALRSRLVATKSWSSFDSWHRTVPYALYSIHAARVTHVNNTATEYMNI